MTHRQAIKAWQAGIKLDGLKVIDWGSGSKPASRYIQHKDCIFTTVDSNPLIAEDRRSDNHIEHDITNYIPIAAADVAFCIEVLEHVKHPVYVLDNIRGNLKEGGRLYLTVPFLFPIHSDADYWRFTDQGITLILESSDFRVDKIAETVEQQGWMVEATAV